MSTPTTPVKAHRFDLQVRWSDVDAYGHVNNVVYFEYFQEARISFLAALDGRGVAALTPTDGFVLARLVVDYRRPIVFRPEPYVISTWPTRLGGSSFDLRACIHDGDDLLASSWAVLVGYNGQGARALTDSERAGLEARVVTEEPPPTGRAG